MSGMSGAICGKSCSVNVASSSYSAHIVSVNDSVNEQNVTVFGDDTFGSWIGCMRNATISATFYEYPTLVPGDTTDVTVAFGYTSPVTKTYPTTVISINPSADAQGIANVVVTFRVTGNAS